MSDKIGNFRNQLTTTPSRLNAHRPEIGMSASNGLPGIEE
jgi:hypothetical protein